MLYYPEGHSSYKYMPTSPHYWLLYFLGSDYDYTKATNSLMESLLEKDVQHENSPVEEPPAKRNEVATSSPHSSIQQFYGRMWVRI